MGLTRIFTVLEDDRILQKILLDKIWKVRWKSKLLSVSIGIDSLVLGIFSFQRDLAASFKPNSNQAKTAWFDQRVIQNRYEHEKQRISIWQIIAFSLVYVDRKANTLKLYFFLEFIKSKKWPDINANSQFSWWFQNLFSINRDCSITNQVLN